jgi:plasmid stabilization system protein ParE
MRGRFLKPAEAEVEEAARYFDEQRDGLGERFQQDLLDAVKVVTGHPLIGKPVRGRVRQFPLRRFPYKMIYVIDGDDVVIVAVAHHRRRPGYWRGRF